MLKLAIIASLGVVFAHDERLKNENGIYIERGCATEEYNEALLAQDPEWQKSLDEFEELWVERSAAIQSGEYVMKQQSIMVPIVYHFVDQNPNSLPDSVFASQLVTLQDDFSAQNSDYTSGTPVEFRGVRSGDTGIRFAQQSLLRVQTSSSSFGTNNAIKYTSQGGSNVVNPNSNLNFWAGQLSGGLLGYAQFPGGNPATDGVVNGKQTLSPAAGGPPYNLGRTATHEIGHWLNLRHIWGDNTGCTNTETISDFVIDTPPSSASNFGCPNGVKRCSANPYSQDMFCNYMDYVYDECMVMFTQLQNARAQASIQQYRGGFSPANYKTASTKYVNWIYFMRFEDGVDEIPDQKCYGDHILFYDNDINQDSDSNIHIYGCMTKVDAMNVWHITDMYFIGENEECKEGDYRASQDLNEGNGDAIYICYNKLESDETNGNEAILDITFIKDDDTSKLDETWTVNTDDNVNPNGVKLNFAIKKGAYYEDQSIQSAGPGSILDSNVPDEDKYIGLGIGLFVLFALLIGIFVWRRNCSKKRAMVAYANEALANEYGATTELTKVNI